MKRLGYLLLIVLSSRFALAQQFFPTGALSADNKWDRIKADWYSQELTTLHEPSLFRDPIKRLDAEEYRFLWLRSFHAPICVRLIVGNDNGRTLIAKEGSVHGGTEAGKLIKVQTKRLSREQVKSFLDRIDSVQFWKIHSPNNELNAKVAFQTNGAKRSYQCVVR
ncbi:MAG: hypothetical protein JO182_18005 [Acidobacteriaceae bacterium]|nr:hypothetical protein [Acidobacteriaceae bacterium]MBV9224547.1 hypothetical protein [Acidobacteriaceae bacterium]